MSKELETAAIVRVVEKRQFETTVKLSIITEEIQTKDELVRRQDVEQLIEKRLESHKKRVEENNALDRLNLNDAKARVNELENLLEDVQNE